MSKPIKISSTASRGEMMHPDFQVLLELKGPQIISLFKDLRKYILEICPDCNELLYHTHALTAVFSVSEKLSDAFCMIPVYTGHMNLGFNKGTLLDDPGKLLQGTGNLIRHIPVQEPANYRNSKVKALIKASLAFAIADKESPSGSKCMTISKIKASK